MTTPVVVAPIVEGDGEKLAVRGLITRIAMHFEQQWVEVAPPFMLNSGKMRKPEELARAIRIQAARVPDRGGVLVLRDGDDDDIKCPVELAQRLAPDPTLVTVPVEIVIAKHEYEAWFLAAATSLRSHKVVRDDATIPADPEAKRDAKGQLRTMMHESYKPTLYQASFTDIMDLDEAAQNSRSFRRMISAVRKLL
ncbi:DUF4276 family protein [Kitasatospora sp. NBC_00240]|uniref:DUF4276 family protein n=1 Tax=Kitasatospora sp. NBC_00240 TaxID=2903567 RepID=UPI00224EBB2A|nr:DUF4276 family protein [Kitasatospora sp. NBC_00240]MCX5215862.1 DUF4276 family protein [Kitasatospora sp. NBC_00240]